MLYGRRKVRWFRLFAVVLGLPTLLGGAFAASYWSSREARSAAAPPPEAEVKSQEFRRISVRAVDEDLKAVLARIEGDIGRRIAVGPGTSEKITVELVLVPWPEALKAVAAMGGCELRRRPDGSFLVRREAKVTFFRDGIELRDALRELAAKRGKTIAIPNEVRGPLPIDLIAVSWDQAMRRILKEAGPYTLTEDPSGRYLVTRIPGR